MFKKLFGKTKTSYDPKSVTLEVKKDSYKLSGPVEGNINGIELLRFEIAKIIVNYPAIHNAWFSKIQHAGEEMVRLGLLVESAELPHKTWQEIAIKISEYAPVDVLPISVPDATKANGQSIYAESETLWNIPLLAEKGTNPDMPDSWKQGILNYYVADDDIENALMRVTQAARDDSYDVKSVFQDRLLKIEPNGWWDDYVLGRWENYQDYFMPQSEVAIFLKTGALHLGPKLEWNEDIPLGTNFG